MAKQAWQGAELAVGAMSQPDVVRLFPVNRHPADPARPSWPRTEEAGHAPTRIIPSRSRLSSPIGATMFL